jgi:hypothetical protein
MRMEITDNQLDQLNQVKHYILSLTLKPGLFKIPTSKPGEIFGPS